MEHKNPPVQEITVKELHAQLAILSAQNAIILDVRTTEEFTAASIPGAIHIPLSELENSITQLQQYSTIYCICHSGVRSLVAAHQLQHAGIAAYTVTGGMEEWITQGYK